MQIVRQKSTDQYFDHDFIFYRCYSIYYSDDFSAYGCNTAHFWLSGAEMNVLFYLQINFNTGILSLNLDHTIYNIMAFIMVPIYHLHLCLSSLCVLPVQTGPGGISSSGDPHSFTGAMVKYPGFIHVPDGDCRVFCGPGAFCRIGNSPLILSLSISSVYQQADKSAATVSKVLQGCCLSRAAFTVSLCRRIMT